MTGILSIAEKCAGAIVAFAVGDALGWPNEGGFGNSASNQSVKKNGFMDWTRWEGGRYWNHPEKIYAGEYSDDTQLMLAVARSIISGDWQAFFSQKELPFWLQYERGGGKAIKNAAKAYKEKKYPWRSQISKEYFNAGGNGAAMRVLPHVIAHKDDKNSYGLIADVISDSILTHGHPRAIVGASCYAYALWLALNKKNTLAYGELVQLVADGTDDWSTFRESFFPEDWVTLANKVYSFPEIWSSTAKSINMGLSKITQSLSKGLLSHDAALLEELGSYSNVRGAGDVAALSVIYFASKYANNPALGIKTAAFSTGTDTDTIAAMTGGLLGMINGISWIPEYWRNVQDYTCLLNIVEILCSGNMREASMRLTETGRSVEGNLVSSPIGKIDILDVKTIPIGKTGVVTITKSRTLHGQTLYLRKYERKDQTRMDLTDSEKAVGRTKPPTKYLQLDATTARQLIDNPHYTKITFRKILKIVELLSYGEKSLDEISKMEKVDPDTVRGLFNLMGHDS